MTGPFQMHPTMFAATFVTGWVSGAVASPAASAVRGAVADEMYGHPENASRTWWRTSTGVFGVGRPSGDAQYKERRRP